MPPVTPSTFEPFFRAATDGTAPYRYQTRLAELAELPDVLDVPTGLGKTAAVVLSWLWRRAGEHALPRPPRRLVYCLPMRTLVEQTERAVCRWIGNLASAELLPRVPAVHVLMGGEDAGDWDVYPERDAVLIGTQDMLLSRLLNRGYGGGGRYRWPMHLGLLGNDCLWVMDEVQLMGSGLATTVQVDAFQKHFWKPAKPCHFLWMSATLGDSLFTTRDRTDLKIGDLGSARRFGLDAAERDEVGPRLRAPKRIEFWEPARSRKTMDSTTPLAAAVVEHHHRHARGRMSLAILNTVPAARDLHRAIRKTLAGQPGPQPDTVLLHGRFRPRDRQRQMDALQEFLGRVDPTTGAAAGHPGLVVVSTQVVEAGVDLSSVRLWSEIAPWSSIIQRLGRLNREGLQPDAAAYFWMPGENGDADNEKGAPNDKRTGPYERKDLDLARRLLEWVGKEVAGGKGYRDALDAALATPESRKALEVEYDAVIRPHDFLELFETEPDLAGGFTDVARYVRDQDRNVDAHVYWRDARVPPAGEPGPAADELCPVPFYSLQLFLKAARGTALAWNPEAADGEGRWEARRWGDIRAGMTLRLWTRQGGYSADLGWTGDPADRPAPVVAAGRPPERLAGDPASRGPQWWPLGRHTADVVAEADHLVGELGLAGQPWAAVLPVAARWHDVGKVSPRWDAAVRRYLAALWEKIEGCPLRDTPGVGPVLDGFAAVLDVPAGGPWAKFPDVRAMPGRDQLDGERWAELQRALYTPFRPGFRHEAVSALAAWQAWQDGTAPGLTGLAVYLIAAHHGKVRTVLRATGRRDAVFGVAENEPFPGWDDFVPKLIMPTGARRFGSEGVWSDDGKTFAPRWPRCSSWAALVADLLGEFPASVKPDTPAEPAGGDAGAEPGGLGPFRLAYLEAVLRAADARASASPGRGNRP